MRGWLFDWNKALRFDDFVIDEPPAELIEQLERPPITDAPDVEQSLDALHAILNGDDMLTAIGQLLVSHEDQLDRIDELEKRRPPDNQMYDLIKRMLTVFDSFERILYIGREFPQEDEIILNWLKSFETLYFRLQSIFERFGLVEIEALGKPVDLDLHEVVELRKTQDSTADTVVAERQKGYLYDGKPLRVAKVVVATQ